MYAFAYTAEGIRFFYSISEALGLYNGNKYSTNNTILWLVIVVLITILLAIAMRLINSEQKIFRQNKLLKILPYLILSINLVLCFFFPRINQIFMQFRQGLDGIIVTNRDYMFVAYNQDGYGNYENLAINVAFESFASDESFYVKLVSMEDEGKEYIFSDDYGTPMKVHMGGVSNIWNINKGNYKARSTSMLIDVDKIHPGYIDSPENRALLKYKVVIYNEHDSKTFRFYFNEFR